MFIVNFHALCAIYQLNFVDQIALQFMRSADFEQCVRNNGTFGQFLPFAHHIAAADGQMLVSRDIGMFFALF